MKKNMMSNSQGQGFGLALGSIAVVCTLAVSAFLFAQIGADEHDLGSRYKLARYQASADQQLALKARKLNRGADVNLSALKNLDMPDVAKIEASMQTVDLFGQAFTRQELCLAQAVYFEARGEPLIGQVAIAEVIMNRIQSRKYPNTACGVVFQNKQMRNRCQFSFACDGKTDRPTNITSWEQSLKVVALVLKGERSGVAKSATHYHADYVTPSWRLRLNKVGEVGRHIFYKDGTA
jgi:spore germination cell wall hydrolase CwlJ-like protein